MDANANSLGRNLPLLEFREFPPKKVSRKMSNSQEKNN